MSELFSLAGKRVLAAGSSQGIVCALSRRLGEPGTAIVLNGRNRAKELVAATVFLSTPASNFGNGDTLILDGDITSLL